MSDRRWPKAIGLVLAAGLLLAACGGSNTSSGGTKKYVVGISNTLTGNGFREEMICSIKAQAKASGVVSKIITANRTTDPSGQIADVRNLISAGVNVIVMNPSDRSALDAVIKEASAKGIVVVTVDQGVTSPDAYQLYNNQVKYAQLGADWLFKQLGGKGNVIEMRGINGVSADADRHQGFKQTLTQYPGIKVVKETFTNWSLDPAAQQIKDILGSGLKVDGIWTSGIDSTVVDGYTTAKKPYVPTIGADNDGFIGQLINLKSQGGCSPGQDGAAPGEPRPADLGQRQQLWPVNTPDSLRLHVERVLQRLVPGRSLDHLHQGGPARLRGHLDRSS